jgi:hypothetical protein
MSAPKRDDAEYLRRNLLVAKATGVQAAAKVARAHALGLKRRPMLLISRLSSILIRIEPCIKELARHRDETTHGVLIAARKKET